MKTTLREIASLAGGTLTGEPGTVVTGVAGIRAAGPGDITFISDRKLLPLLDLSPAAAALVPRGTPALRIPSVAVESPDLAFAAVIEAFMVPPVRIPSGVHPAAVVGEGVRLGRDVTVMAYAVVEAGAGIGDGTVLFPFVYVGHGTKIGKNCRFYPHVSVRERVTIGDRVIIHNGSVIGSDGFGYVSGKDGHRKIPQLGTVEIGDDVEIGANVTVDRARFEKTVIGRGTKIDNLVQIAHNVVTGEHCILVSQVGIAGSTRLGNFVTLGGQVGVVGHIELGDRVMAGAQSGISKSFPAGSVVFGSPAQDHRTELKEKALLRKLPEIIGRLERLEKGMADHGNANHAPA
ncbi:MAG: UDP-3-O-(3-hydroxymyristoyl)glucosamine N-acyltransferase [Planctomycetota bacterium]